MDVPVKEAARAVKTSPVTQFMARFGFVANGLVHILIGVIALAIAGGGAGDSDQNGAFEAIAGIPLGLAALWLLAVALWGLGAWYVAEGILASRAKEAEKWGARLALWGRAVAYFALGWIAITVALGAHPSGDAGAKNASRGILSIPGGPIILGIAGAAIGVIGVVFVVRGITRGFRKTMSIPAGAVGTAVTTLGVVGYIAKGLALVVVGVLLLVAAVRVDPNAAGGLDGAINALMQLPYGPLLAGGVGFGFIAYGVFCLFRARYARL